jgi:NAD(P)-dependent dehydrogenase (short-subunit alcohol dehydrogenase family)
VPEQSAAASQSAGVAGKVVIVTGAGRGIGKVLAEAFAAENARLVISDIDQANLASVAEHLDAGGGPVLAMPADVTDESAVSALLQATVDKYGRVDVLINNAGIYYGLMPEPATGLSRVRWDRTIQVNVWGTFLCSRVAFPYMKEAGGGSIVNVSSTTVFMGSKGLADYVASKGAVIALTRVLAQEFGDDHVRVNAVAPGGTWTEATQLRFLNPDGSVNLDPPEKIRAAAIANQAIKRQQRPEDLIGVVRFLASDSAAMVTGQVLVVDGGMVMR